MEYYILLNKPLSEDQIQKCLESFYDVEITPLMSDNKEAPIFFHFRDNYEGFFPYEVEVRSVKFKPKSENDYADCCRHFAKTFKAKTIYSIDDGEHYYLFDGDKDPIYLPESNLNLNGNYIQFIKEIEEANIELLYDGIDPFHDDIAVPLTLTFDKKTKLQLDAKQILHAKLTILFIDSIAWRGTTVETAEKFKLIQKFEDDPTYFETEFDLYPLFAFLYNEKTKQTYITCLASSEIQAGRVQISYQGLWEISFQNIPEENYLHLAIKF